MWSDWVKRSPQHLIAICWSADPIGSNSMRSAIVCSRVWNVEGRGWTASPAILMSLSGCSHTPCKSCNGMQILYNLKPSLMTQLKIQRHNTVADHSGKNHTYYDNCIQRSLELHFDICLRAGKQHCQSLGFCASHIELGDTFWMLSLKYKKIKMCTAETVS